MARKGTIKNMGKVQREMSDAWKARAAEKRGAEGKASSTERLRKAALAEINGRLSADQLAFLLRAAHECGVDLRDPAAAK